MENVAFEKPFEGYCLGGREAYNIEYLINELKLPRTTQASKSLSLLKSF